MECTVAVGTDPGPSASQSFNLPAGWTAEVWANVPGARLASWNPDGRLLVSNGGGGTFTMLTPTEPGKAPASALLKRLNRPPAELRAQIGGGTGAAAWGDLRAEWAVVVHGTMSLVIGVVTG